MTKKIPEFIIKEFGSSVDEILKLKSTQVQTRQFPEQGESEDLKLSAKDCEALCKKAGLPYKTGYEERVIKYTCSNSSVDRYGDIIDQKGWELDAFKTNPVIMGFHNYGTFPIGNSIKTWIDKDGTLKMYVLFANKEDSEESEKAFKLAKAKFMRSGSVGFLPKTVKEINAEEKIKLGMSPWGVYYTKQELLEFSLCGVPANAGALQDAINKGIIAKKDLSNWVEETAFNLLKEFEPPFNVKDFLLSQKAEALEIQTLIFDKEVFSKAEALNWAEDNDFKSDKVDENDKSYRLRQEDPALFDESTFVSKKLTDEVVGVFGKKKEEKSISIIPEEIKKYMDEKLAEIETKAGAVLSKKNRELLTTCLGSLQASATAIDELLKATSKEDPQQETVNPPLSEEEDEEDDALDMYAAESLIEDMLKDFKS